MAALVYAAHDANPALFTTPGVSAPTDLGSPATVAKALGEGFLLQHPEATSDYRKPAEKAPEWNQRVPITEVISFESGAKIMLAGIEGADSTYRGLLGLKTAVIDCRGEHTSQWEVRGITTATPQQHRQRHVKHRFVEINRYMLKHGNGSIPALEELLADLEEILHWIAEGYSITIHCISPLSPRRASFGCHYLRLPDSPYRWRRPPCCPPGCRRKK